MNNPFRGLLVALLFPVLALAAEPPAASSTSEAKRPPGYAVASAHPLATDAGLEILAQGGNAFDAAVAVSAALAVVEPTGSGLGGGGFWMIHREFDDLDLVVDGREVAPISATGDMYLDRDGEPVAELSRNGPLASGIPGEPAALVHIARVFGELPLAQLLAPAIRLAQDGIPVDEKLAGAIIDHVDRFSPAALAVFAPNGTPLKAGDRLVQPDLAATLRRFAQGGRDAFYGGETGARMLAGVRRDGGIWQQKDLEAYRIVERKPIVFLAGPYRVTVPPLPSAGGIAFQQMFQILGRKHWPPNDPVLARHEVIEAMRRVYRDRAAWLGDPAFVDVPVERLLSRDYTDALADGIELARATPSIELEPPNETLREGDTTSHLSIIDAEGNRVSATLSINLGFGSGYMAPGTGYFLNNEMDDFSAKPLAPNAYGLIGTKANVIAPHKRMLSSMTPLMIEGPDGVAVLGTPGGSRIISMSLLASLAYIYGYSPQDIVKLGRYHHQFLPDTVVYEPGAFSQAEIDGLRKLGHQLSESARYYGNMQIVVWDRKARTLSAVSDPRGIGAGRVVMQAPPNTQAGGQGRAIAADR